MGEANNFTSIYKQWKHANKDSGIKEWWAIAAGCCAEMIRTFLQTKIVFKAFLYVRKNLRAKKQTLYVILHVEKESECSIGLRRITSLSVHELH